MTENGKKTAFHVANRLARLAAVQAIYERSFGQQAAEKIVSEVVNGGFASLLEEQETGSVTAGKPDEELFSAIVNGAAAHESRLDELISGALDARLSSKKIERLLQSILRAGAFELVYHKEIPAGVIINDYVDVTHAFYSGNEPGLVNGVLDRIGTDSRR